MTVGEVEKTTGVEGVREGGEQRHKAGKQLAFVCEGRVFLWTELSHSCERSNSENRMMLMGTQLCGEYPFAIYVSSVKCSESLKYVIRTQISVFIRQT